MEAAQTVETFAAIADQERITGWVRLLGPQLARVLLNLLNFHLQKTKTVPKTCEELLELMMGNLDILEGARIVIREMAEMGVLPVAWRKPQEHEQPHRAGQRAQGGQATGKTSQD